MPTQKGGHIRKQLLADGDLHGILLQGAVCGGGCDGHSARFLEYDLTGVGIHLCNTGIGGLPFETLEGLVAGEGLGNTA